MKNFSKEVESLKKPDGLSMTKILKIGYLDFWFQLRSVKRQEIVILYCITRKLWRKTENQRLFLDLSEN